MNRLGMFSAKALGELKTTNPVNQVRVELERRREMTLVILTYFN